VTGGAPSEWLEAVAPLLDVDVVARCPECEAEQPVGFDIQSFLLERLLNERPRLLQEIHLIASSYGWTLPDILALPRDHRRVLAAAVEDERAHAAHSGDRSRW
jgi:hypothetical protein